MKTSYRTVPRIAASALVATLLFRATVGSAQADEKDPHTSASFEIKPEYGASDFAPGDGVTVTSLRGNREHLELGGHFILDGTYTLSSADSADLAWFATTRAASGASPVTDAEHVRITRGSGTFHLEKSLHNDGWLHLSFYVDGHSIGGVYFGEKGFDRTVLRKTPWSAHPDGLTGSPRELDYGISSPKATGSNRAIMDFLGDPVPTPVNLDDRYSPQRLKAAFTELSKKLGFEVLSLKVDDSEYPFVVFGVLAGHCDYHALANGARQLEGYTYAGSVTRGNEKGTCFALDLISPKALPRARREDCNRRLMVRLEMLAAAADAGEAEAAQLADTTESK